MLSKIHASNFMSWKDLTFNVTSGATLIDGWNEDDQRSEGSGKSAVLNAISWGVYGKIPKEANIDELIKDGESSCSVILEFDNGDSIVRTRKPNDVYILKAGATIKGKDARETQTLIEEYIGCNFETFCQSVYFAQNYDKKFLTSNQEDKGKILSSIQNLQIFDKARKEVMELLKTENDNIDKLKNNVQMETNNVANLHSQKLMVDSFIQDKIQKHKAQVDMLTRERDLLEGHCKNMLLQMADVSQKKSLINLDQVLNDEKELNAIKSSKNTELSGVVYQKSQIDSVLKSIQAKEQEGKTLANKYQTLECKKQNSTSIEMSPTYLRLLSDKSRQMEYDTSPMYVKLSNKKKDLENYIQNPTKVCPSCGTELKNVDTSHVQKELNGVNSEMSELTNMSATAITSIDQQILKYEIEFKKDLESIDGELQSTIAQLQSISDWLDSTKSPSMDELQKSETEIKDYIKKIDKAIYDNNQKNTDHSYLTHQHSMLTQQYENYEIQKNRYEKTLSDLGSPDVSQDQAKLNTIVSLLNTTSEKVLELNQLLEKSKDHASRLETLKDGFKEIKSYVFVNALNELNYRTNQYLNDLFDTEASIKFTSEDQKIESKIVLSGNERGIGLLSGGQNRRFNLAVDLALADIVSYRKTSKLDLLVFDEYFKDLSEISMEKSLDLLKSRKCPVILIEHNSLFKTIVDGTFFVRLENGTSYESRP